MQAIGFYLALPFLYLISILPQRLLYGLSDLVCFFLYDVAGYRKKVVSENLEKSFPEKTTAERKVIMRNFYHYLCDLFLETFKTLTMSRSFAMRHCTFDEQAMKLFNDYYEAKKSIIVVMGHFGNWEWAGNAFSLQCKQQLFVIYHPLVNPYYNKLIIDMRMRFGTKLIAMQDTFREMVRNRKLISSTAFIADQTPSPEKAYWTTFLNQDTPVFWGTEAIARKLNYPVVYASVHRVKRGYYKIFAETIFETPSATMEGEISEAHTQKLENEIRMQPEIWLWSHRRWKHKKP
ncbi:MAG: lysophospholipid acyltransferase family protein [Chitinophagaceae bacterium]|nr:lysophospholipid acyltransferase family protein [Chitinophagaceae bacterium]